MEEQSEGKDSNDHELSILEFEHFLDKPSQKHSYTDRKFQTDTKTQDSDIDNVQIVVFKQKLVAGDDKEEDSQVHSYLFAWNVTEKTSPKSNL